MAAPKPIALTQVDAEDYDGPQAPQPFLVVGALPLTKADYVEIDDTPADAAAVAADLQAVIDALVAAGLMEESTP